MTNYEKIKSMSFDEMYKFLDSSFLLLCEACLTYCNCDDNCDSDGKCSFALKKWLKAECEED